MKKVVYVVPTGDQWGVQCDHCKEELKDTQLEAITSAKDHVAELPAGTVSQILVESGMGRWRTEWTYGEDPFPPRG